MEDFSIFLGRFHPLIVHLPIGILIMAFILEFASQKTKKFKNILDPAISITLFWGCITSITAASAGWLISFQGGYDSETLYWHKWLGVSVIVISFISWLIKGRKLKFKRLYTNIILGLVILLLLATGHLGGNLTHGEEYLFLYSPQFIKKMVGMDENPNYINLELSNPDSIKVYKDLIEPILNSKCIECHNQNKNNGGLILTNYKDLIKGGESGKILDIEFPLKSMLLTRVTLPKKNVKFMPPNGSPLTFAEIRIFEWWMKSGAYENSKFTSENLHDKELKHMLFRDYKLDFSLRSFYEKVQVDSLSTSILNELKNNRFILEQMGEKSNMVSVDYEGNFISKIEFDKLLMAKEQITWLDLSNCNLTDSISEVLPKLHNLTRLNLNSNPISDLSIAGLKKLKNLEVLNLYGTEVTDKSFEYIKQIPALKRLYLWKTPVTVRGLKELNAVLPNLKIISGSE